MKKLALFVVLGLAFQGCFTARVASGAQPGQTERETGFSLLWGITSTKTAAVECPHGLQAVETYFPWYWWLLSGVTAGIVTPIVKEYTCAAAPAGAPPAAPSPLAR